MSGDTLSQNATLALLKTTQSANDKISSKLKGLEQSKQLEKIAGTAEEFEAMFIAEMMKPMFEGISTEAPFGGGKGEEVFRSFMLQEYGKITAKTGSIGITDSVKEHLIKLQELNNETNS